MKHSKCVALILALLMTFISVPVYATDTVIATGEHNQFQAVVPFDPNSTAQEASAPAAPAVPILTSSHNDNPLTAVDPVSAVPESSTPEVKDAKAADVAYASLSEQARGDLNNFVDDLVVKVFQDAARIDGTEVVSVPDPAKFIQQYIADPENRDGLVNFMKNAVSGDKVTNEFKTYASDYLIPGTRSGDTGSRGSKSLENAVARRVGDFESSTAASSSVVPLGDPSSASATPPPPVTYMDRIRERIGQAQQNLHEKALAQPFEYAESLSGDVADIQEPEAVQKGPHEKYRTVDSVYVGKDYIRTQKMAAPPEDLHPYLKWVLYARNLTPENLSRYIKTRAKILELYKLAKAGGGKIRYNRRVCEAFLPKTFASVGNYELVQKA